tara:strand:- start:1161 stop:1307 length:147 start_codon:yes stop_codon:yes gene_type:complete
MTYMMIGKKTRLEKTLVVHTEPETHPDRLRSGLIGGMVKTPPRNHLAA